MKLFLDTNVVVDFYAQRDPFFQLSLENHRIGRKWVVYDLDCRCWHFYQEASSSSVQFLFE